LLRKSTAALEAALGERHPDVATAMRDLANASGDAGRRGELLDSAAAITGALPDLDPIQRAADLNARGSAEINGGRSRQALALFRESLDILSRRLPPNHPNRLVVTRNVVAALIRLGRWDEAEQLHRQVVDANRRDTVETAPRANDRGTTGLLAAHRGRLGEAEAELRSHLESLRRLLAPGHDRINNTLRNVGLVVAARGRIEEGLAILDSAVSAARATAQGHDHNTAFMAGQRAPLLLRLGRYDEAGQAADEAARAFGVASSPGDLRRAEAILWRGMVAFAREDPAATGLFEEVVAMLAAEYDAEHHVMARARCALGTARVRAGRTAAAAALERAGAVHARWGLAAPLVVAWGRAAYGSPG
jgi:tetratricopeptide (TPR) repeat protein